MKKRVDLLWMRKWWKQVEAWIDANLTALFENDEELDGKVTKLQDDVREINNTVIPEDALYVADDDVTEEDILAVITPETEDDEDTEDFWATESEE